MKTRYLLSLSALVFLTLPAIGKAFDLGELPKGKSVTLPRPATTLVPLTSKVRLTATDRQQTVKLTSTARSGRSQSLVLAIYDDLSDKVRYVKLKPGGSMIYSFRGMNTIQIVPKLTAKNTNLNQARLKVESNRPLGVGH